MTPLNRIRHGTSPYAGAQETARICAPVLTRFIPPDRYAAGTSVWTMSPIEGRLRRYMAVIDTATVGTQALFININGIQVQGAVIIIPDSAAGTPYSAAIQDTDGIGSNLVREGDVIELAMFQTVTAGAAHCLVTIDPSDHLLSVPVF